MKRERMMSWMKQVSRSMSEPLACLKNGSCHVSWGERYDLSPLKKVIISSMTTTIITSGHWIRNTTNLTI